VPVVPVVLRPRPLESIAGERVAYFGTAAGAATAVGRHLAAEHGADVRHVSGALADRALLREELDAIDAETFVVEIKAAAIDVVAETAAARGVRLVAASSDVVPVAGHDLADELDRLVAAADRRAAVAT